MNNSFNDAMNKLKNEKDNQIESQKKIFTDKINSLSQLVEESNQLLVAYENELKDLKNKNQKLQYNVKMLTDNNIQLNQIVRDNNEGLKNDINIKEVKYNNNLMNELPFKDVKSESYEKFMPHTNTEIKKFNYNENNFGDFNNKNLNGNNNIINNNNNNYNYNTRDDNFIKNTNINNNNNKNNKDYQYNFKYGDNVDNNFNTNNSLNNKNNFNSPINNDLINNNNNKFENNTNENNYINKSNNNSNINKTFSVNQDPLNKTSSFVKDEEKEKGLNKLLSNFNEQKFNLLLGQNNENNTIDFIPVPFNEENKSLNSSHSSRASNKKIPGKIYSAKQSINQSQNQ